MIAIDTNLLVYAHRPEFPAHERSRALMRERAEGLTPWSIPIHCLVEFAGVVSHPRRFIEPSSPQQVAAQIAAWRSSPSLVLLEDGLQTLDRFLSLIERGDVRGPQVHDARIAALCLAAGVSELWTCDRDYGRFPDLRIRNPLVV